MTEHRPLTRPETNHLTQELAKVPAILRELDARADPSPATSGQGGRRQQPRSRPPVDLDLIDEADTLNAAIRDGARRLWKHLRKRNVEHPPETRVALRSFIIQHAHHFECIPDATEWYELVCDEINRAARLVHLDDMDVITSKQREQANRTLVTPTMLERLAPRFGVPGLNRHRLRRLVDAGLVRPVDPRNHLYQLGDILTAHQQAPSRGG